MKKSIIYTVLASAILSTYAHAEAKITPKQATVVATMTERPGNPSVTPDGRLLLSVHPLDHPTTKVIELSVAGNQTPYPTMKYAQGENSQFKAVIAIRTDDNGVAWILDLATHSITGWDTRNEALVKTIKIPASVLKPTSFLQDFALDQKRQRIIIADMTQNDLKSEAIPAFVTVDLKTGEAVRVAEKHPSMKADSKTGFALNPITIDPSYEWVYFGAVNGRTIYRVKASEFDNDGKTVADNIKRYADKPYSDGITVDSAQNVYVTDIENNAIGVSTPKGYRIIATLSENQTWPDGMSFGPDGYVYVTVNQLNRTAALNNGKDTGIRPFEVVKIKALTTGTTGR
ncbi:L-dopachrome tautomerase-related protein [Vibrio splendidus]|uniref:L-dopachrome tautomerase-related protein n=1 Tax=Vibrio splendidus TaxID=29497 RepID=UPI0024698674|nr:L-dopachrome tautomerase-related protein [Vibrio splendidus]MDH5897950.1 major royal jelly family protein [Vibrio splendidus]